MSILAVAQGGLGWDPGSERELWGEGLLRPGRATWGRANLSQNRADRISWP